MHGGGFASKLFFAKLHAKGIRCLKKDKTLWSTAVGFVLLWKLWMILSTPLSGEEYLPGQFDKWCNLVKCHYFVLIIKEAMRFGLYLQCEASVRLRSFDSGSLNYINCIYLWPMVQSSLGKRCFLRTSARSCSCILPPASSSAHNCVRSWTSGRAQMGKP